MRRPRRRIDEAPSVEAWAARLREPGLRISRAVRLAARGATLPSGAVQSRSWMGPGRPESKTGPEVLRPQLEVARSPARGSRTSASASPPSAARSRATWRRRAERECRALARPRLDMTAARLSAVCCCAAAIHDQSSTEEDCRPACDGPSVRREAGSYRWSSTSPSVAVTHSVPRGRFPACRTSGRCRSQAAE